jgi:hypothetical protein
MIRLQLTVEETFGKKVWLVENNHFSSYIFHQQNSPTVCTVYQTQLSPSNARMLRTPFPPPTNVDATTTIAVNASATPLASGSMPIAAIAAAATTNASTIAASPGGTPFTAMGLNIRRGKLLVTIAPPGVSGKQQNLGFSASLQPTTESNSGSSANLVGRFGATHPGGTSTIT